MSDKPKKIEVFTAGCPLCNETLQLVKEAVSGCGCEVTERRCSGDECCDQAKQYKVRALPTVVADGEIVFEGRINRIQARLLTQ